MQPYRRIFKPGSLRNQLPLESEPQDPPPTPTGRRPQQTSEAPHLWSNVLSSHESTNCLGIILVRPEGSEERMVPDIQQEVSISQR